MEVDHHCKTMTGIAVEKFVCDERSKRNNYIIRSAIETINFQYLQIIILTFQLDQSYFSQISSKHMAEK